ncbi:MAG: response regulator transcription factor [Desulforhabdus sp.]|jgi:DNA-binding NarL/FixJ family response regulator|nr:response regulator transcription factor [Desulforhabdus sp.]
MAIKILLADDHTVVRHGLRTALEKEPELEVVAEADNGRLAVILAQKLKPDVVLMDIHMPDLNGTEATRQIVSAQPDVRVIALSMYSQKRYVLGMFEAGAAGFLIKNCSFEELAHAVRTVAAGKRYLNSEIAEVLVTSALNPAPKETAYSLHLLSPREREVIQLIAEGHSSKSIATQLCISGRTVEAHRREIMRKLNVKSVAELTKFALREGLTSIEL